ncbi:MAG TPA: SGNH/GDSL hydrolase family protein [Pyrinomonadaceae bacterium]|jgi:lysophospholipase L1-like esterase
MILNSFNGGRRFITHGRRVFIILLLTLLLGASCARPSALVSNDTAPPVYVAVGDSTGIGLGARDGGGYVARLFARIERKRPGSTLVNLSAAGATAADAVDKQLPRLAGTRAALVTVCVGMNDLLRGREAKQFAEHYETLVAGLGQSGGRVVLVNLPDVASAPAMRGTADESLRIRLGQFNKAIGDVARRHRLPLVDLYQLSGETTGTRPEFFSSDGLHPSDLGYARWAEAMWPAVAQAIEE